MRIKRAHEEDASINLVPIIDVVVFLLTFFLVATKFAEIERDVAVQPPSSRHARPIASLPQELIVNVGRDGRLIVAGQEMTLEGVDGLIARAIQDNPKQSVVVRGDKGTVLQYAVNVLDVCEKRGVARTFLATTKGNP